jgi:excisionase family DNA binding protein
MEYRKPELRTSLGSLKQVLNVHRQRLEDIRGALEEYENALDGLTDERPKNGRGPLLLSIPEVCLRLGEDKGSVYRRLRGGEIRSLKLGNATKVRQADLEEYLKDQRNRTLGEG